jgi:ceramide glucosyltransferase
LFCVSDRSDAVVPIIERVAREYPSHRIRVLYGSGRIATNDKVAKLVRLVDEAQYETLVINDSDVRAEPDYLRTLVAPLANPKVGAVTCFYGHIGESGPVQKLQSVGMISDFYVGILVAWLLEGVKFALGPTIATTRSHLVKFGGYEMLENRPADDLLVGRLIAESGYQVVLLPYTIHTVADYQSLRDLLYKRLRWLVVMRNIRPWGHLGLLFTFGLAWSLFAVAVRPTVMSAAAYLGTYFALRLLMTWELGTWGLKEPFRLRYLLYIPVWDALAILIWLASFTRSTIRWRDLDYYIRNGELVPASLEPLGAPSEVAK